jgi:chromatin segregation and condensation protein Rec8/ScpA/Scc1 (kleisin family)
VTIFGLLELYRKGEITWEQDVAFGPISVRKAVPAP